MKIWQQDVIKLIYFTRKKIALSALLFLAIVPKANSATVDVTTEFIADLQQPQKNNFVNTTPVSGFCVDFLTFCRSDEFSILIPDLTARKYFDSSSPDLISHHTSISLDGRGKEVTLKDIKTGKMITGIFRLTLFGMQHNRLDNASGHLGSAMSNTGTQPSGGCYGLQGSGGASAVYYKHGWRLPARNVSCYKKLNDGRPFKGDVRIDNFSFGYTLMVPNPLSIPSGEYEGEVVYSVGDGGDINFNALETSDSEIKINIKATVSHAFYLNFAPGTENVSLAPKGGWGQWRNGGRVPDSLRKEVPFTLSSSSGFTVNMTCTIPSGAGCGLRNEGTGEDIPLEVALTLPGYKTESGSEVRNLLMDSSPAGHVIAFPGEIVYQRRSQVDFKVRKPGVETMMKSPGSVWKGDVTLIFDTQMD
ncbi:hypothetical protein [Cedecea neteri]|uniref:Fimbrial protein n=1 Tax=Cedecea neteri TaxID=158822 RepID=A0A291DYP2_9ENTR|nr:hypothetical protein [Cedecea neteri]ATF92930.1 hypothetical protein CO704_12875 [Cedecea neteri]